MATVLNLTALVAYFNRCLRPQCAKCQHRLVDCFLPAKRDVDRNAIVLTVSCHGEFDTMELAVDDVFAIDWARTTRGVAFSDRQAS